jgi:hypothetical protein
MKKVNAFFLLACSICLFTCSRERATSIVVGAEPSFSFSGSGKLASFTIYGPMSGERIALPDSDVATVVWQIKTSKGYFNGAQVEGFRLGFAKPPEGYTQVVPSQSDALPLLPGGAVYSFLAETTDAPIAEGYFYMDGTQAVQIKVPDACLILANGRETRVSCTTKQPYQEPTNLAEFVRDNRIAR